MRLVECIPNISEGRNPSVISRIVDAVVCTPGVKVLSVDSGYGANRTVITFAGAPDAVEEAAFALYERSIELLDINTYQGVHPYIGAVDVCPFVPLEGIEMDELVQRSRIFARRVSEAFSLPVYGYAESALSPERKDLARIRRGGLEGLFSRAGNPDYGESLLHPTAGASVIGARKMLIALNINLDTTDVDVARQIASRLRKMRTSVAQVSCVKAIGWFVEEYNRVQVSLNFTDYRNTSLFDVFEVIRQIAGEMCVKVTGSELVGMIPLEALTDCASSLSTSYSIEKQIDLAVEYLNLNEVKPFYPHRDIIDYALKRNFPGN